MMSSVSAASSSAPRGVLRCVDRCCPSTRQTHRSDKRPLKPRDIWAIRFYLDEHRRLRDRALFGLAIDSKLRGCGLVKLKIGDLVGGGEIRNRATVISKRPVDRFNSRS